MVTKKCMRYQVVGKVQGVWFRDSTVKQANLIGVTGWVRNVPDGSVEVVASGDEHALEMLYQWLQKGPTLAKVESVEYEQIEREPFTDFSIRYN